jgi:hypothetical protein
VLVTERVAEADFFVELEADTSVWADYVNRFTMLGAVWDSEASSYTIR